MSSDGFIRKSGNKFYIKYSNGAAWLYSPSSGTILTECESCCPIQYLSQWEDPNSICADAKLTHPISLKAPYYIFKGQPNNGVIQSVPKPAPASAYSLFCGTPPTTNISSRITIKITDDPVFSGTYIFDYKPSTQEWRLNTWQGMTDTSVSAYQDWWNPAYGVGKKIIGLVETTNEPSYKGYVEYATSGNVGSNLSGVYAFPCQFVFTAIQAPEDIVGIDLPGGNNPVLPLGTGHRAVIGFNPPLRWRHPYSDWIISDKIGHNILPENYPVGVTGGTAPAKPWFNTNYFTGVSSQPYSINISGISNNPYDLSSSSSKTPVCTGLSTMGFSYRTSGVGVPFDSSEYGVSMVNRCSGIRPHFHKYQFTYNSSSYSIDETVLSSPKQYLDASIEFDFSCRQSGTICTEFDSLTPVSTGYSTINNSCFGSYIDADFMCGDNFAHPSGNYFTTEGVQDLKVVYSGLPYQVASVPHVYPMVKATNSTGHVYKANSGQIIFVDYDGVITPDGFRSWINSNFNFVTLDNSDNITIKWPGVDVYWNIKPSVYVSGVEAAAQDPPLDGKYYLANVLDDNNYQFYSKDGGDSYPRISNYYGGVGNWYMVNVYAGVPYVLDNGSTFYPDLPTGNWSEYDETLYQSMTSYDNKTAFARVIPEGGEGSNVGIYVFKAGSTEFIAQYSYDSDNNRYVNINDSDMQMRFSVDKWQLGKIETGTFVVYYELNNVTCGNPLLLDPKLFDYSDYEPVNTYGTIQIPVTCLSQPIGQWVATGSGTGSAISVKDPLAGGSTGSLNC
jgi:hypothetical protein